MPPGEEVIATVRALNILRSPPRGQLGQGMVEYSLILTIVSVAAILLLVALGHSNQNMFSNVNAGMAAATGH